MTKDFETMGDPTSGLHSSDITVVIPAYRAETTIRRTIDSVLAQPGVTAKVVVVVDGKLDRTAELVAGYPQNRVLVVEHAINLGAAVSRNDGLALVETPYVMFLDADDYVEGRLLSGLFGRMRGAGADIGFGPVQVHYEADLGDGPLSTRLLALLRSALTGATPPPQENVRGPIFVPDFTSSSDIFRKWHLEGIFVPPCSVVWRTDFIRAIGGWDPELTRNDDGELVMRAILRGAKFVVSNEGRGVYVKHSSASLSNRVDNLDSQLIANEKLIALESRVISTEMQRHVCAGHYFNIAWQGYVGGREDLAELALKRSRSMGFGTRGRLAHRIAFRLFGLKLTVRLLSRLRKATTPARLG